MLLKGGFDVFKERYTIATYQEFREFNQRLQVLSQSSCHEASLLLPRD